MIRLNLRLRRSYIALWSVSLWLILLVFPPAYENYYPTPRDRQAFLLGMQQNSGMTAMWGPLEAPASLGQIVMWEAGSLLLVLSSVMAVLLVVGLHRREESQGQMELRLSTGISRLTPAAAALTTTALASIMVGAGSALILWLSGFYVAEMPTQGALISGMLIALNMIGSALLAQLTLLWIRRPEAVTRAGLASIAASFITRSVADSEDIGWLNWASPLGWKTVLQPYVRDDWRALLGLLLLCLAAAAVVLLAELHREYGRALVNLPQAARRRERHIRGPVHLALTLNQGTVLTWVLIISGLTAFFITITGSLSGWMEAEENIGRVFKEIFGSTDMKTEFIAYVAKVSGILVAIMGVQIMVTYRNGELDRTVDLQRATGIGKFVPLGSAGFTAWSGVLAGTIGILAGGWVGLWSQELTTETDYDNLLRAAWSQLAPTLLLTSLAIALIGWLPRFTQAAWAPVIASAVLTLFGPVLDAPQWLIDLSPFEYVVSVEEGSWPVHVWMAASAMILSAVGLAGANLREIR